MALTYVTPTSNVVLIFLLLINVRSYFYYYVLHTKLYKIIKDFCSSCIKFTCEPFSSISVSPRLTALAWQGRSE